MAEGSWLRRVVSSRGRVVSTAAFIVNESSIEKSIRRLIAKQLVLLLRPLLLWQRFFLSCI